MCTTTPHAKVLASTSSRCSAADSCANSACPRPRATGRVRLAAFQSVLSTIVPRATESLTQAYPGIEVSLVDVHPGEAMRMLRTGAVDVALIFRYADTPAEDAGFRLVHIADDAIHLVTREAARRITDYRDAAWIGGCERCQHELINICQRSGFTPRISYVSDDMVVMQALVAAGMGVATLPGLALRAPRPRGQHR
jgi:DNA-binding transcriptional LysR family regulator